MHRSSIYCAASLFVAIALSVSRAYGQPGQLKFKVNVQGSFMCSAKGNVATLASGMTKSAVERAIKGAKVPLKKDSADEWHCGGDDGTILGLRFKDGTLESAQISN